MEKAKQAVSSFLSHDGKHKTTVDEDVRAPVTQEHVRPHQHENVTTALDKEVHQDHHHTTVQPITQKETLPEQHHHNLIPVKHKTFHHGQQDTRATLDREAAKYRDTSETHSTTHSASTAPIVTGERIHHHVHEHVQPVIQKETVQPHVVHTTIPIHETHYAAPVHHGTSILPAKTLQEFTSEQGGLGKMEAQKLTEFEGCPKPYKRELQSEQLDADKSMHLHGRGDNYGGNYGEGRTQTREGADFAAGREGTGLGSTTTRTGGPTKMNALGSTDSPANTRGDTSTSTDEFNQTKTGALSNDPLNNKTHARSDSGVDMQTASSGQATTGGKPSLMDRLNPLKDADGDGKKGFMS